MAERPTSRERAAVFLRAAMQALDEAGGELPLREILHQVENRVTLTDRDREVYEKSGYVRWRSVLHFWSIDAAKAGFIRKANGRWILTPEGKAILSKPPDLVLDMAQKAYRDWRAQQADPVAPGAEGRAAAGGLRGSA